ncbi:hypothetical protein M407DRAFT_18430 [Tulasnella calospora MUT 4182]|uniref:Uncharacterized protein n=1 Tax=Tulasnella calospora MUT 4182 TaxID=1051891 RepID=A0A0C3QTT7_9AGAM|nr:hypothetical protein M407DRAFT_18430 [Tulasnella calospora MUT 4182]
MSSESQIEPFRGSGTWEECNNFIRAIRAAAWRESKLRDLAWMADFASLYFSYQALRWHSQLPEDVRQDWSKLESEILRRWAPLEEDSGTTITPTPAAAPSLDPSEGASSPLQGVIKVVLDESDTSYYLKFQPPDCTCHLTENKKEALHVRCNSLPGGTLLELIDLSRHFWLAVQWESFTPVIGVGSTDYAQIPCFDSDTLKSSWTEGRPMQLITCTVLKNGEIIPVWKKDDANKVILVTFVAGLVPLLVADPTAYSERWSKERRAKLFIECTDHAK